MGLKVKCIVVYTAPTSTFVVSVSFIKHTTSVWMSDRCVRVKTVKKVEQIVRAGVSERRHVRLIDRKMKDPGSADAIFLFKGFSLDGVYLTWSDLAVVLLLFVNNMRCVTGSAEFFLC